MAIVIRTTKQIKKLDSTDMYRALQKELRSYEKEITKSFQDTTKTWKHKPLFENDILITPGLVLVEVWTDDEIYNYVDKGTKPHLIKPRKKGGRLAFKVGGTPKTIPNVLSSSAGSPGNKRVVLPPDRAVHHPGTEARNFEKMIKKEHKKDFYNRVRNAVRTWVKQSGHAVR